VREEVRIAAVGTLVMGLVSGLVSGGLLLGATQAGPSGDGLPQAPATPKSAAESSVPAGSTDDEVAAARNLATHGKRAEAAEILQRRLETHPGDTDARVLLGTILSWEGRYDDAREQLRRVLDASPGHYDAVRALINVELWSNHPERAEALADEALKTSPASADLLIARAKARRARGNTPAALADASTAATIDPSSDEARRLRRSLVELAMPWEVGGTLYYDWFSDGRADWREGQLSLWHKTGWGSWIGRYWHANRYGTSGDQLEFEAYPSVGEGTYVWLDAGVSNGLPYPDYRLGAEVFQSLGLGFEGSLGWRHLKFSGGSTEIWTASAGKYLGAWLLTGRVYYVPDVQSDSWSYYLSGRLYFGDGTEYVTLRAGRGSYDEYDSARKGFVPLSSDTVSVDLEKRLTPRWTLTARLQYSRSGRAQIADLRQRSASLGLFYRF
jgi:YaiO family outer membrane protein